jgi:hypothetical protein
MALVKGENSFVTIEEAEDYMSGRIDVAAWVEATAEQKEAALISATTLLNEYPWLGTAVSDTQSCAFPRKITYFEPIVGKTVFIEGTPSRVIKGCTETAYHMLNNDGLLDSTGKVDSLSIAGIKLVDIQNTSTLPALAEKLMKPLWTSRSSARMWWRAN